MHGVPRHRGARRRRRRAPGHALVGRRDRLLPDLRARQRHLRAALGADRPRDPRPRRARSRGRVRRRSRVAARERPPARAQVPAGELLERTVGGRDRPAAAARVPAGEVRRDLRPVGSGPAPTLSAWRASRNGPSGSRTSPTSTAEGRTSSRRCSSARSRDQRHGAGPRRLLRRPDDVRLQARVRPGASPSSTRSTASRSSSSPATTTRATSATSTSRSSSATATPCCRSAA